MAGLTIEWYETATGGDGVRLLVAILVVLGQVAGPWLCCCPTTRATAPVDTSAAAESTCPHCKKEQSAPPDQPAPGLPDPCPCGGAATLLPAPPAKSDAAATFVPDLPAVAGLVESVAVALPGSPVGVSELPFLPPGTRLFVHHVLRC